jgi:hypothetical protein
MKRRSILLSSIRLPNGVIIVLRGMTNEIQRGRIYIY